MMRGMRKLTPEVRHDRIVYCDTPQVRCLDLRPDGLGCLPRWVRTTAAEAFGKDGQWVPCKESPLIDAGPTWAEYRANGGLSKADLNGNRRRSGSRLDIGCCETRHTGFCIMFK